MKTLITEVETLRWLVLLGVLLASQGKNLPRDKSTTTTTPAKTTLSSASSLDEEISLRHAPCRVLILHMEHCLMRPLPGSPPIPGPVTRIGSGDPEDSRLTVYEVPCRDLQFESTCPLAWDSRLTNQENFVKENVKPYNVYSTLKLEGYNQNNESQMFVTEPDLALVKGEITSMRNREESHKEIKNTKIVEYEPLTDGSGSSEEEMKSKLHPQRSVIKTKFRRRQGMEEPLKVDKKSRVEEDSSQEIRFTTEISGNSGRVMHERHPQRPIRLNFRGRRNGEKLSMENNKHEVEGNSNNKNRNTSSVDITVGHKLRTNNTTSSDISITEEFLDMSTTEKPVAFHKHTVSEETIEDDPDTLTRSPALYAILKRQSKNTNLHQLQKPEPSQTLINESLSYNKNFSKYFSIGSFDFIVNLTVNYKLNEAPKSGVKRSLIPQGQKTKTRTSVSFRNKTNTETNGNDPLEFHATWEHSEKEKIYTFEKILIKSDTTSPEDDSTEDVNDEIHNIETSNEFNDTSGDDKSVSLHGNKKSHVVSDADITSGTDAPSRAGANFTPSTKVGVQVSMRQKQFPVSSNSSPIIQKHQGTQAKILKYIPSKIIDSTTKGLDTNNIHSDTSDISLNTTDLVLGTNNTVPNSTEVVVYTTGQFVDNYITTQIPSAVGELITTVDNTTSMVTDIITPTSSAIKMEPFSITTDTVSRETTPVTDHGITTMKSSDATTKLDKIFIFSDTTTTMVAHDVTTTAPTNSVTESSVSTSVLDTNIADRNITTLEPDIIITAPGIDTKETDLLPVEHSSTTETPSTITTALSTTTLESDILTFELGTITIPGTIITDADTLITDSNNNTTELTSAAAEPSSSIKRHFITNNGFNINISEHIFNATESDTLMTVTDTINKLPYVTTSEPSYHTIEPDTPSIEPSSVITEPNVITTEAAIDATEPDISTLEPDANSVEPGRITTHDLVVTETKTTTIEPVVIKAIPSKSIKDFESTTEKHYITTTGSNTFMIEPNITTTEPDGIFIESNIRTEPYDFIPELNTTIIESYVPSIKLYNPTTEPDIIATGTNIAKEYNTQPNGFTLDPTYITTEPNNIITEYSDSAEPNIIVLAPNVGTSERNTAPVTATSDTSATDSNIAYIKPDITFTEHDTTTETDMTTVDPDIPTLESQTRKLDIIATETNILTTESDVFISEFGITTADTGPDETAREYRVAAAELDATIARPTSTTTETNTIIASANGNTPDLNTVSTEPYASTTDLIIAITDAIISTSEPNTVFNEPDFTSTNSDSIANEPTITTDFTTNATEPVTIGMDINIVTVESINITTEPSLIATATVESNTELGITTTEPDITEHEDANTTEPDISTLEPNNTIIEADNTVIDPSIITTETSIIIAEPDNTIEELEIITKSNTISTKPVTITMESTPYTTNDDIAVLKHEISTTEFSAVSREPDVVITGNATTITDSSVIDTEPYISTTLPDSLISEPSVTTSELDARINPNVTPIELDTMGTDSNINTAETSTYTTEPGIFRAKRDAINELRYEDMDFDNVGTETKITFSKTNFVNADSDITIARPTKVTALPKNTTILSEIEIDNITNDVLHPISTSSIEIDMSSARLNVMPSVTNTSDTGIKAWQAPIPKARVIAKNPSKNTFLHKLLYKRMGKDKGSIGNFHWENPKMSRTNRNALPQVHYSPNNQSNGVDYTSSIDQCVQQLQPINLLTQQNEQQQKVIQSISNFKDNKSEGKPPVLVILIQQGKPTGDTRPMHPHSPPWSEPLQPISRTSAFHPEISEIYTPSGMSQQSSGGFQSVPAPSQPAMGPPYQTIQISQPDYVMAHPNQNTSQLFSGTSQPSPEIQQGPGIPETYQQVPQIYQGKPELGSPYLSPVQNIPQYSPYSLPAQNVSEPGSQYLQPVQSIPQPQGDILQPSPLLTLLENNELQPNPSLLQLDQNKLQPKPASGTSQSNPKIQQPDLRIPKTYQEVQQMYYDIQQPVAQFQPGSPYDQPIQSISRLDGHILQPNPSFSQLDQNELQQELDYLQSDIDYLGSNPLSSQSHSGNAQPHPSYIKAIQTIPQLNSLFSDSLIAQLDAPPQPNSPLFRTITMLPPSNPVFSQPTSNMSKLQLVDSQMGLTPSQQTLKGGQPRLEFPQSPIENSKPFRDTVIPQIGQELVSPSFLMTQQISKLLESTLVDPQHHPSFQHPSQGLQQPIPVIPQSGQHDKKTLLQFQHPSLISQPESHFQHSFSQWEQSRSQVPFPVSQTLQSLSETLEMSQPTSGIQQSNPKIPALPKPFPGIQHPSSRIPELGHGIPQPSPEIQQAGPKISEIDTGIYQSFPGMQRTNPRIPDLGLEIPQTLSGIQQTNSRIPDLGPGIPQIFPGIQQSNPGIPELQSITKAEHADRRPFGPYLGPGISLFLPGIQKSNPRIPELGPEIRQAFFKPLDPWPDTKMLHSFSPIPKSSQEILEPNPLLPRRGPSTTQTDDGMKNLFPYISQPYLGEPQSNPGLSQPSKGILQPGPTSPELDLGMQQPATQTLLQKMQPLLGAQDQPYISQSPAGLQQQSFASILLHPKIQKPLSQAAQQLWSPQVLLLAQPQEPQFPMSQQSLPGFSSFLQRLQREAVKIPISLTKVKRPSNDQYEIHFITELDPPPILHPLGNTQVLPNLNQSLVTVMESRLSEDMKPEKQSEISTSTLIPQGVQVNGSSSLDIKNISTAREAHDKQFIIMGRAENHINLLREAGLQDQLSHDQTEQSITLWEQSLAQGEQTLQQAQQMWVQNSVKLSQGDQKSEKERLEVLSIEQDLPHNLQSLQPVSIPQLLFQSIKAASAGSNSSNTITHGIQPIASQMIQNFAIGKMYPKLSSTNVQLTPESKENNHSSMLEINFTPFTQKSQITIAPLLSTNESSPTKEVNDLESASQKEALNILSSEGSLDEKILSSSVEPCLTQSDSCNDKRLKRSVIKLRQGNERSLSRNGYRLKRQITPNPIHSFSAYNSETNIQKANPIVSTFLNSSPKISPDITQVHETLNPSPSPSQHSLTLPQLTTSSQHSTNILQLTTPRTQTEISGTSSLLEKKSSVVFPSTQISHSSSVTFPRDGTPALLTTPIPQTSTGTPTLGKPTEADTVSSVDQNQLMPQPLVPLWPSTPSLPQSFQTRVQPSVPQLTGRVSSPIQSLTRAQFPSSYPFQPVNMQSVQHPMMPMTRPLTYQRPSLGLGVNYQTPYNHRSLPIPRLAPGRTSTSFRLQNSQQYNSKKPVQPESPYQALPIYGEEKPPQGLSTPFHALLQYFSQFLQRQVNQDRSPSFRQPLPIYQRQTYHQQRRPEHWLPSFQTHPFQNPSQYRPQGYVQSRPVNQNRPVQNSVPGNFRQAILTQVVTPTQPSTTIKSSRVTQRATPMQTRSPPVSFQSPTSSQPSTELLTSTPQPSSSTHSQPSIYPTIKQLAIEQPLELALSTKSTSISTTITSDLTATETTTTTKMTAEQSTASTPLVTKLPITSTATLHSTQTQSSVHSAQTSDLIQPLFVTEPTESPEATMTTQPKTGQLSTTEQATNPQPTVPEEHITTISKPLITEQPALSPESIIPAQPETSQSSIETQPITVTTVTHPFQLTSTVHQFQLAVLETETPSKTLDLTTPDMINLDLTTTTQTTSPSHSPIDQQILFPPLSTNSQPTSTKEPTTRTDLNSITTEIVTTMHAMALPTKDIKSSSESLTTTEELSPLPVEMLKAETDQALMYTKPVSMSNEFTQTSGFPSLLTEVPSEIPSTTEGLPPSFDEIPSTTTAESQPFTGLSSLTTLSSPVLTATTTKLQPFTELSKGISVPIMTSTNLPTQAKVLALRSTVLTTESTELPQELTELQGVNTTLPPRTSELLHTKLSPASTKPLTTMEEISTELLTTTDFSEELKTSPTTTVDPSEETSKLPITVLDLPSRLTATTVTTEIPSTTVLITKLLQESTKIPITTTEVTKTTTAATKLHTTTKLRKIFVTTDLLEGITTTELPVMLAVTTTGLQENPTTTTITELLVNQTTPTITELLDNQTPTTISTELFENQTTTAEATTTGILENQTTAITTPTTTSTMTELSETQTTIAAALTTTELLESQTITATTTTKVLENQRTATPGTSEPLENQTTTPATTKLKETTTELLGKQTTATTTPTTTELVENQRTTFTTELEETQTAATGTPLTTALLEKQTSTIIPTTELLENKTTTTIQTTTELLENQSTKAPTTIELVENETTTAATPTTMGLLDNHTTTTTTALLENQTKISTTKELPENQRTTTETHSTSTILEISKNQTTTTRTTTEQLDNQATIAATSTIEVLENQTTTQTTPEPLESQITTVAAPPTTEQLEEQTRAPATTEPLKYQITITTTELLGNQITTGTTPPTKEPLESPTTTTTTTTPPTETPIRPTNPKTSKSKSSVFLKTITNIKTVESSNETSQLPGERSLYNVKKAETVISISESISNSSDANGVMTKTIKIETKNRTEETTTHIQRSLPPSSGRDLAHSNRKPKKLFSLKDKSTKT
ncbi:uncharacterized protein LOC143041808 [Oratosquilla oratoria]|uniref:uncharacterized protein LOC143041808 n=1 Tax=Oratosquilla oratoria TaxID=337810 RepID=UPI003F763D5F